jgi:hypothetical protein
MHNAVQRKSQDLDTPDLRRLYLYKARPDLHFIEKQDFDQAWMGDSSYRRNFDLRKNNKIHHHSWKEHLKMSKIAKFGCELL